MTTGNKKIIPIVFSTNDNYAQYVDVCIHSIIENASKNYEYKFFVFHTDLSEYLVKKLENQTYADIKCINVAQNIENLRKHFYEVFHFSKEMYYRILIPEILSEFDKVIYLDCDMIVLGDISELFETDLQGKCIAGCRNFINQSLKGYVLEKLKIDDKRFINSGMLVIDCDKFRKENYKPKMIEFLKNNHELRWPDQDMINVVLKDDKLILPSNWNYMLNLERELDSRDLTKALDKEDQELFFEAKKDIKLLHFTAYEKPWNQNGIGGAEYFWKYAQLSVFYDDLMLNMIEYNKHLESVALNYLTFKENYIELCYSNVFLDIEGRDGPVLMCFKNGQSYEQKELAQLKTIEQRTKVVNKIFSCKIYYKDLKQGVKVTWKRNNKFVCPRLRRLSVFPHIDDRFSYFYHKKILVQRKGNSILFKKASRFKVFFKEIFLTATLFASLKKKKIVKGLLRCAYFVCRPFMKMGRKIWLVSDRQNAAGDNGEAIFKYLRANKKKYKNIKPIFVIDKNSPDFARMKKYGKVIGFKTLKHYFIDLFADVKLASHPDLAFACPIPNRFSLGMQYKTKKVFLQHGIIKDNLSDVYNKIVYDIDMFVTSTQKEYDSIVRTKEYLCDENVVKLTGLPRYDYLENKKEKLIIINPTWRKDLATSQPNSKLAKSEYFQKWNGLLHNKEFVEMLKKHGYKCLFVPHAMMIGMVPLMKDLDSSIEIAKQNEWPFSKIFSCGALMLNDFSSTAMDFVYLNKPVIYYQFDKEYFETSHTYKPGYFDYEKDGFGEVVFEEKKLLDILKRYLENDCALEEKYANRINEFFKYHDKNNCQRVIEETLKIKK